MGISGSAPSWCKVVELQLVPSNNRRRRFTAVQTVPILIEPAAEIMAESRYTTDDPDQAHQITPCTMDSGIVTECMFRAMRRMECRGQHETYNVAK